MEYSLLVNKLQQIKDEKKYTLHDLSRKLDIQVTTIERWLKTKHMNKLYAQFLEDRMPSL